MSNPSTSKSNKYITSIIYYAIRMYNNHRYLSSTSSYIILKYTFIKILRIEKIMCLFFFYETRKKKCNVPRGFQSSQKTFCFGIRCDACEEKVLL